MIIFSVRSIKKFGSGVKSRVGRVTRNATFSFLALFAEMVYPFPNPVNLSILQDISDLLSMENIVINNLLLWRKLVSRSDNNINMKSA